MQAPDWTEQDVTSWATALEENRGLRSKTWLQSSEDASFWLRKAPWPGRPHEHSVEHLMLHLAALVGLRVAESRVCRWQDSRGRQRGLLSRLFVDRRREQLVSGEELLLRDDAGRDVEPRLGHTLAAALRALERLGLAEREMTPFLHMLAFDLWIGNADRHGGNWSVILSNDGSSRLSPMYDPAGCLGAELRDDHPLLSLRGPDVAALASYIERCPSGFGDGKALIPLRALLGPLESIPAWNDNVGRWVAEFAAALQPFLRGLAHLDAHWLPPRRRRLMEQLLAARLDWLTHRVQRS